MARIIDADGHITEPRVLWEQYTESAYRDRVHPNPPQCRRPR
jgi:hypothetical protein